MVKKMKSGSEADSGTGSDAGNSKSSSKGSVKSSHLAASVKDSAQQIWLAGMGAFSKAQEEGTKVFESLVKEGMSLQKKTQGIAEDKISEVTGRMSAMADTVTSKAGQNWDKLESLFEARTAKALSKLGVPTAKDVDALVQRVDALAAAVAQLAKATPAQPAAKAKRAARTAARPAAETAAKTATKTATKTTRAAAKKAPAKRTRRAAASA